MAGCDVLSVDTAYDDESIWFANSRNKMYEMLTGGINIVVLNFSDANRDNMHRILKHSDTTPHPCHSVVISSHGAPGKVLDNADSPGGVLFSEDDPEEELSILADNRSIYMCCCESAQGALPDILIRLNAKAVIGFTLKPSWDFTETAMLWRDFDIDIVKRLVFRQGTDACFRIRDDYISMIDSQSQYLDEFLRDDMQRMMTVIETMIIK